MKYVIGLLLPFLLIACVANDHWEGFSTAEVMRWKELGLQERTAQKYQANGLSAMEVQAWMNQGFVDQDNVILWSKSRFNPVEAKIWRDAGFDLDEAKAWASENFTAMEATNWKMQDFTLTQAVRERAKGLSPTR
ncbi:hypothetical protein [Bowmanella dokdonensis]|uniref:Lipoprotein n=1 Tax=Bowmanella dokdonensis TaxID=751969 RepID=A0A939IS92_9ALTE|nr:hypothetical protein [Bowmanella dokdonensis]MBN7826186.1 hypothetical protein [Bowmanella dokdonensis]